MKRVSVLVTVVALFFLGFGASAQTKIKLAHVNSTELMKIMPGVDTAQKAIQDFYKQVEDELETMYTEYKKIETDIDVNGGTWTQSKRQKRMEDLQDLARKIKNYEQNAQDELQEKQEELLKPIIDRAKSAIGEVAKENGINYVFDSGMGVLLWSEDSDDILPLVKKKLGIK